MIKIPYGISDFQSLRLEKYFYQDRTSYIEVLEKWSSKYLVFLRPRRFGKSLFISVLHHYYGLEYKQEFQQIFGDLYIGKKPTENANAYLVLRLDFSRIDTATHESTYQGFLSNVLYSASIFLGAYRQFYTGEQKHIIENGKSPEEIIKSIFRFTNQNQVPHKIYVLIDEYDHFANELLSFDMDRFKADVSRNGFVRKFYESLKTATGEGIIDRIFITGVSPITLDSLTSGFNICDNISLNPLFHDMMGFTHIETVGLLNLTDVQTGKSAFIAADLAEWYNGYRFSRRSKAALFNPDMILYFLKEYNIDQTYPEEMMDVNIVSDYSKIRRIFKIGGNENEKFGLLEELVNVGYIDFSLTRLYNVDAVFTQDDFLSLLFYMGLLTLQESNSSDWRFKIPNYVIKKLYFEYFAALFLENTQFASSMRPITRAIDALVNEGNPDLFFKVVELVLKENDSNRNALRYGEEHLQTLMAALLFPYKAFRIHSEYEIDRGYADIFLERIPGRNIKYEIVLELKYVKKAAKNTLAKVITDAETQLNGYMTGERFSRPDARGFYVVFFGGAVYKWGESIKK